MKKYFQFKELGTNYRKEILGGLTTFLAMAYILAVNPSVLTLESVPDLPAELRMDKGAVFTATALAAGVGSILMGVIARFPISLAPGMGLNAFFAFSVVLGYGIAWETALTGVLISGIIFVLLSLSGIREKIINAIPAELKHAVGAGIGLFITFIGLQNAGIVVNDDSVLIGLGDLTAGPTLLAVFGIIVTVLLMTRGIKSGVFLGMVITSIVGMIFGQVEVPTKIVSAVPSLEPTFGAAFEGFSNPSELFSGQILIVILTFLFVAFFDTAGTLVAVAQQAGLMKNNVLPGAGKGLLADSLSIVTGAIFGTSTTTSYVESTSGVAAGARSGFAAVVTGLLFILALFFFPLLAVVTSAVTAPALIIVGVLMASSLRLIEWDRFEVAVPAFFTVLMMPLTYSIATGIACGFLFYPITMAVSGQAKKVHPIMWGLGVVFLLYFIFLK
ncbi:NCS2 family permease [Bacillus massiliglaciei]|uniref:NCS2 family permease n=1 Tax=Bacillus massiliglaciei TaxID=1816693 RepID=UPI000A51E499|nr:NCS2 family permease [Bacillus massiliglaciei]